MALNFQVDEATAAQRRFPLYLVDATDGITPETGEAGGQPQLSKNGAAFGNTSATLTAIGNGSYYVELTAGELDTLGMLTIRFKSAATAEFSLTGQVVAYDPYAAYALASIATETRLAELDAGNIPTDLSNIQSDTDNIQTRLPAALVTGRMDTSVSALDDDAQSLTDLKDFADDGYDPATDKVQGVVLVDTTTLNSDMRGTENAALASVLGALADAAADGDPTAVDTIMQYAKQLINIMVGSDGIVTWPAEAAPADGVSIAEALRAVATDVSTTIPATITTLQGDTDDIQTRLPDVLVGGGIKADVLGMQADVVNASALATDAVNEIRDAILPTQNVAFDNIMFLFVDSVDHVTPVTGATGTGVTRSIDGAAFAAGTGTLAEIGNGIYQYDASMADMNGGIITFRFTASGGTPNAPDDRFLTIVTGGGV